MSPDFVNQPRASSSYLLTEKKNEGLMAPHQHNPEKNRKKGQNRSESLLSLLHICLYLLSGGTPSLDVPSLSDGEDQKRGAGDLVFGSWCGHWN